MKPLKLTLPPPKGGGIIQMKGKNYICTSFPRAIIYTGINSARGLRSRMHFHLLDIFRAHPAPPKFCLKISHHRGGGYFWHKYTNSKDKLNGQAQLKNLRHMYLRSDFIFQVPWFHSG